MPPIRNIQHQINLVLGSNLPYKLAYRLCPKKAKGLQRHAGCEIVRKEVYSTKYESIYSPSFLVFKKNGSWCLCMDNQAINWITLKYRFPITRLDNMNAVVEQLLRISNDDLFLCQVHQRRPLIFVQVLCTIYQFFLENHMNIFLIS